MHSLSESTARIVEIESRQDEAIRQLAELELRLEALLAACATGVTPSTLSIMAAGSASTSAVKAA